MSEYLLADIGNSRIHLFDGNDTIHLPVADALDRYAHRRVYYINVNAALEAQLHALKTWENIAPLITLPGSYETMGIDRKALCLSRDNALFIDAGSAITVDAMRRGIYEGGFILPGLAAWQASYARISPALEHTLDADVSLVRLPRTTKEQISYGIIASIKTSVASVRGSLPIYVTGGDGRLIADIFPQAIYDETLVFKGMRYALQQAGRIALDRH